MSVFFFRFEARFKLVPVPEALNKVKLSTIFQNFTPILSQGCAKPLSPYSHKKPSRTSLIWHLYSSHFPRCIAARQMSCRIRENPIYDDDYDDWE